MGSFEVGQNEFLCYCMSIHIVGLGSGMWNVSTNIKKD